MTEAVGVGPGMPDGMQAWITAQLRIRPERERTIHRARNTLWIADSPVGAAVVKSFGSTIGAMLLDRVRGSKARRSFAIASELRRRGVPTPEPLAWAEATAGPGISRCAYASRAVVGARQLRDWLRAGADGWESALPAAGAAIARAQLAGVRHHDLSPGNLIWGADPCGASQWHLVDLNRIAFVPVDDPDNGPQALGRLSAVGASRLLALLGGYAGARGLALHSVIAGYLAGRRTWLERSRLQRRSRAWRRHTAARLRWA